MLNEILENFSEDELLSFVSKASVEFSKDVASEQDGFSKNQLAKMISCTKEVDFLFSDKLRSRLIDRMKAETFTTIFPELGEDVKGVRVEHYDRAINWAKENLPQFAKKLGLLEVYTDAIGTSKLIESISRIEPRYSLYPYQRKISREVVDCLQKEKRVLIHLPTGSGKTRTAMNIASEHLRAPEKKLVLWLADREELCQQAFSEFKVAWEVLGDKDLTLYGFYSSSGQSLGGIDSGFIVGGLHTFLALKDSDSRKLQLLYQELRKSVTLVIFDEAHKAIAPKFSGLINDFIDPEYFKADLIGLTATPGRKYSPEGGSDEDRSLAKYFSNNKVSMSVPGYTSPIDYLVENGYLAKANFKPLTYDYSGITAHELKDAGGTETMKALARNVERNRQILDTVIRECEKEAKVIIFSCTVEHAVNLATLLACKGIKAASVDSKNDSPESRRAKIRQYKSGKLKVLVNFNVLTAGFDAPMTNVVVIAKPMKSLVQYLQMAGRAMRGTKNGGNKECNIYTVMDDIPEFQNIHIASEYWNKMWVKNEE
ncbi:MAG: DEAD/DEAH box helicase [Nitrosopumilus sp.]|nr:DEAD/DEAH box helicase [Nitrosopumilus sp.]